MALFLIRRFEKKRLELRLKAELNPGRIRKEYLEFLDQMHDGYVETDREGNITFVNKPLLRELGYANRQELCGQFFWELSQEKYQSGIESTFNKVFESHRPLELFKLVIPGKEGKRMVGEAAVSPVLENGTVSATKTTIRNITRRAEAEKEQDFQKDFLDSLLQQSPIAIAVVDKSRKLSVVNEAFSSYFGGAQEGAIGKRLDAYLSAPELMPQIYHYMDKRSREPLYLTGMRNHKDGSVNDLEIFVQPFFAGSIKYGHLFFFNDISEQRKAEAQLVNTTTAHRAVLDTLQDAYFEADASGFLSYVNQPFVDAVGYTEKEELIGTHFRHLVARSSGIEFLRKFRQLHRTGKSIKPIEIRYWNRKKGEFVSEVVASPIMEEGKVVGSRGIVRDISIRVKAEELLKAAKEEAERDLEIGREIQQGFFPFALPEIPGWEIASSFKAARQVSGDFYDVFPMADERYVGLVVADVCDKGVGAALFMVLLRSLLRSTSELYGSGADAETMLREIVERVNTYVVKNHGQSNMFATLVLGILDPSKNTLFYVNGGHDAPLLIDSRGKLRKELLPTGPAFGFSNELPFEMDSIDFMPGDLLLAFTDGFAEARNVAGEFYTGERLLKEAGRSWPSAFSAVWHLETEVFGHMGEQIQQDDLTMLGLRRRGKEEAYTHLFSRKASIPNLHLFRNFVQEVCQSMPVEEKLIQDLKLAVDEVCSNLIQYGYSGRDTGKILLRITDRDPLIEIRLEDTGHPFDPDWIEAPNLSENIEERKIGGLGLFLVRETMDEVSYESHEKYNVLILKKRYKQS
jgi:PAS domain S-box-containing protein